MTYNLEVAATKIEIADVVYKYCRAIDRMDRELLESVFHEDSIHHHGEYEGPSSDFCNFAFDILSEMEFTQHHIGNILIEVKTESLRGIRRVEYFIDSQKIGTSTNQPFDFNQNVSDSN